MKVVYASVNAVVPSPHGHSLFVQAGQHWPADDPLVRARPDLFSEDPRHGLSFSVPPDDPSVEQATAAPGERRNVSVPNQADVAFAELELLRAEAAKAGIKVDSRWSLQRLREAVAAARA